ncbi:MAG: class I SAM-dependent methyltransferase [Minisyncoccota bacterium]
MHNAINDQKHSDKTSSIDILAVPSGLGRELLEVAEELALAQHPRLKRIRFYGLDLDPELVAQMNAYSTTLSVPTSFFVGDALDESAYPKKYDMILSTGLTEFLDDTQTGAFYKLIRSKLKPKGVFVTSGMLPHRLSIYLMSNIAELHAFYRQEEDLRLLAQKAGFTSVTTYRDPIGLQSMLVARE